MVTPIQIGRRRPSVGVGSLGMPCRNRHPLSDGGRMQSPLVRRLEEHRKNPACATCHSQMDPLGFALENFDAIGKWRTTSEAGTPIDATAVLPGGVRFSGPQGLREVLLGRRDQFVNTVTQKLLSYALGRGVEYYDLPAVRKIVRNSSPTDYRWSSIILEIVQSTPFLMRTTQATASGLPAGGVRDAARRSEPVR